MTSWLFMSCFHRTDAKGSGALQRITPVIAGAEEIGNALVASIVIKSTEIGAAHVPGSCADAAATSGSIPVGHADPAYHPCSNAPSTSYPVSHGDSWDVVGANMTTAVEAEACVDAVLEGSIKSAKTLFERYDMNLDARLNQQDYYDLMLELNLALTVQDYQQFVDATFAFADADCDCLISINDFIPLYKAIAAARRAFRHQDHHHNGQIDRHDFFQVLAELEVHGGKQGLRALADAAFSVSDSTGRGIVNFGQLLVWYGGYLAATGRHNLQET